MPVQPPCKCNQPEQIYPQTLYKEAQLLRTEAKHQPMPAQPLRREAQLLRNETQPLRSEGKRQG